MIITAIKTPKISLGSATLHDILDACLPELANGDIVVITSKIVSICEGNIVPFDAADKEDLIIAESDRYLPATLSRYGYHFTITNNTLIAAAGIDESNGENHYILWPKNPQATANEVRAYLSKKHGLTEIGVVITDSTCQILRRGTVGIAMAHSGFLGLRNYVGTPDLFGRPFGVTQAGVASGVAAAAVLAMGEGTEQTPLCLLRDLPFVTFTDADPSAAELAEMAIPLEEDLFAPFLSAVEWKAGGRNNGTVS